MSSQNQPPPDPTGIGPAGVVQQVLSAAVRGVTRVVRPEAVGAVATEFGFPLILTLAVLAFLVVQGRLDSRDPKLRLAPQNTVESTVEFKEEDQL
jgi:hypothetical protein